MKHATVYLILSSLLHSINAQDGAIVQTTSGAITGHPAKNRPDVSEYLGIPYAAPPIDDLRFAAPINYTGTDPITASDFSPDCPQQGLTAPPLKYEEQSPNFKNIVEAFAGGRGNEQSEDCLTLNIWTKRPGSSSKTGVLVWFHGGRFTLGDTNTPFYNGQYLTSAQDIIVVTVNYRVNIFGFSGAPDQPFNVGLLDQRKAIEWVHTNIAGFGGDPSLITIIGQSAGGSAVDFYSYAYASDPLVAGLISHSGTSLSFAANEPDFARSSFQTAAANVSCSRDSDAETLSCMRSLPFKDLLKSIPSVKPLPSSALAQPVFHPTIDNLTIFPLSTYRTRGVTGQFAPLPYLAGTTDHESGFYRLAALSQKIDLSPSQWLSYESQGFTCPTRQSLLYRTTHNVPAYRYRYFGTWSNLELYPGSGAYHGSDLHMVFGGDEDITGVEGTREERWTREYMQRAWGAFVRKPDGGVEREMGWPRYVEGVDGMSGLVRLGLEGNAAASYVGAELWDGGCASGEEEGDVKLAQGAF